MSSISQNTIRTPRMHLRSATQRRNTPSALARRTRALETRRTILGNTIIELEADLRQQRAALATLTIEVDHALRRRDDEGDRYERLRTERDNLRYTLLTNFNQSDLGMEYTELKRRWFEYVHNEDEDTDINYFNNLKPTLRELETALSAVVDEEARLNRGRGRKRKLRATQRKVKKLM